MPHVFTGKFLSGGKSERLLLGNGFPGAHHGADAVHGIDRIHRCGARGFERFINNSDVPGKFSLVASAKGECALSQAISGGGGDGRRAAHNHVPDGSGGFAEIFRGDDFELMREQPLFDEQDGIACAVEGDGAVVLRAAADGDIHGIQIVLDTDGTDSHGFGFEFYS